MPNGVDSCQGCCRHIAATPPSTEGFVASILALMGNWRYGCPITRPYRFGFVRPALTVDFKAFYQHQGCQPLHLVVDATGLKVSYGRFGEWKVPSARLDSLKRRTWRKLHLGVDLKLPARSSRIDLDDE